ncbi:MAG: hypothetical protein QGI45_05980, partial [Myxococcota bacterium]|nr:hypothetical protein [Myxococcota bacterium]
WDRSPQSYALDALGEPEFMVVSAAFPGETGWSDAASVGRAGGETFKTQWAYAREVGPQIVLVNSFNEWVRPEEQDSEFSNDIEPSEAHGHFYLDLLTEQVAEFKGF